MKSIKTDIKSVVIIEYIICFILPIVGCIAFTLFLLIFSLYLFIKNYIKEAVILFLISLIVTTLIIYVLKKCRFRIKKYNKKIFNKQGN